MDPEHKPFHIRVTRIHASGGHSTRDIDMRNRESWKRLVRGAKDTLEEGGEHHMRPLYQDDGPAVSVPAPLKLRVEELEAGIQEAIKELEQLEGMKPVERTGARAIEILEALLAKRPEAKKGT